jgi:plastocyanin
MSGARRWQMVLAALALTAAACGDDDGTAESTGEAQQGATVEIEGFAFPDEVRVRTGETVRVVNRDSAAHTFSTTDGTLAEQVPGGGEATFVAPGPGSYDVICAFHPAMRSTLEVAP